LDARREGDGTKSLDVLILSSAGVLLSLNNEA
jgi:hypothetical protein